ncbi:MAG: tetratricopeptide repeat protein, partial [Candidatus Methylomirabilis sp.]
VYHNISKIEQAEQKFRDPLGTKRLRKRRISEGFKASILNNLGIALALKGKSDEAEKSFKEAVHRSARLPDARANLGKAYIEKGRFEEGIAELEAAIRLDKRDPRFHFMLGQAYYQKGEMELASIQLVRALSLRLDFPEARALLQKIGTEKASERGRRG